MMIHLKLLLISFILFYFKRSVVTFTLESTVLKNVSETESENKSVSLMSLEDIKPSKVSSMYRTLVRVKKSGESDGAGKFAQAAKMDQLKVLRLILQNFKNSWDSAYIGGAHPLHPNVPKAIVQLYKTKIVAFFFPPVGEDAVKGK